MRNKRIKRKKKSQGIARGSSLEDLKISYEKELGLHNELQAFIDNREIPLDKREARVGEFKAVLDRLNGLIAQIEESGHVMTKDEIVNGFELGAAEFLTIKRSPVSNSALALPDDFELSDEIKNCYDQIESGKNLHIDGEAGTGKTTTVAFWRAKTKKNYVIVAPTGLAAINSGGQTIHSFFNFPPTLVQKKDIRKLPGIEQVLKNLDALVVDEASMMRADLLDGIDHSLRINRENLHQPFGGVQIILVGDLHQLPPIVGPELAEHYGELYETPYFFSAKVFREARFYNFKLTKNYRQQSPEFMALLSKIRNKTLSEDDRRLLNTRVSPALSASWEDCIRLTPTNAAANTINEVRLEKLPGKDFFYEAVIKGDYDQASYPTETNLRLRVGAQVLMIKNDSPDRRWVNGSIGEIVELNSDAVRVRIGHGIHDVTPVVWEKPKYKHDNQTGAIISEIVGSFEQYPIRLAWAITIHKSQGQTFSRVVVDFGRGTFVDGQAYVALTRCRTFEGLVLARPVQFSDITFDERVHRISRLYASDEVENSEARAGEQIIFLS